MTKKFKKPLQKIVDWVESFTGVSLCVKDVQGSLICRSPGFTGKDGESSKFHRTLQTDLGKDSPELAILFGPVPDESLADRISEFIQASYAQMVLQKKSLDSLSKEIVDNYSEINLFYKLSESLLYITDIKETCRKILDQALERIPSEKAAILLYDAGKKKFILTAGRGSELEELVKQKKSYTFHGCALNETFTRNKPLFINQLSSLEEEPGCDCHELMGKQSVIAIPMPLLTSGRAHTEKEKDTDEEVLGIIILSDKKAAPSIYTSPELKLLMSLAFQTSISISHWKTLGKVQTSKEALEETYSELMRTYETLQRQASLNEQMNQISKRIHAAHNIKSIFSALADYSKNLLRAAFCIAAYKQEDGNIHFSVTTGFEDRERIIESSKNLKPGPFLNILESGEPFSYDEEKDDPVDLGFDLKKTHVRNFFGIPLVCHGIPMGLIGVFNHLGPGGFVQEDRELLNSLALQATSVLENAFLINKLKDTQYTTMVKLAELAEKRDPETGKHLDRMKHYSKILAREMGKTAKYNGIINGDFVEALYQSSPLHDIGKVGIYDNILLKPGKLTVEEFEVMKTHTTIGGEILQGPDFLKFSRNVALGHHEKFNGNGYPNGLKGEEISLEARIVSLADVYDALTSKRVYKASFPFERTYAIIMEEKGNAFDPEVVEAFENTIDQFKEIQEKYGD